LIPIRGRYLFSAKSIDLMSRSSLK